VHISKLDTFTLSRSVSNKTHDTTRARKSRLADASIEPNSQNKTKNMNKGKKQIRKIIQRATQAEQLHNAKGVRKTPDYAQKDRWINGE